MVISMPEIYTDTTLEEFNRHIGEFLRAERRDQSLTLEDVIQGSGLRITSSSLSNIEQGRQRISAFQLFLLSKSLRFSVDKLFSEVNKEVKKGTIENRFSVSNDTKDLISKL